MFARWLHVRLKAAEKALRHGRIDDVYAAVQDPALRQHPRGQKLIDGLLKPLTARVRLHRQAGRYRDALADLDRIESLGRATPEVETLRQQVLELMRDGAAREAQDRAAYERAADHVRAGRLETGRLQVERLEDTHRRAELNKELHQRRQRAAELLGEARAALEREDVPAALRLWEETCRRHGHTQDTDRFASRLANACRQSVQRWHREGQIGTLVAAQAGVAALRAHAPALAECERLIALAGRATGQLAAREYTGLRQTLLRLKAADSDVTWVTEALGALAKIAEGQELLMASPLGLCASTAGHVEGPVAAWPADERPATVPASRRDAQVLTENAVRLDRPLLMLVDGGGSSLLLSREQVRIGRAGTTAAIDVPIPADLESHHADVVRRGDDYFLAAYGPAEVNRKRVTQALLRDGDRIALGSGAKLTFHKPSAKSESAVLRLSHRCRLEQDVGDVILFRDTCLIGGGRACHVRTREDGQVVLFDRGGALCARQTGGAGHLTAPPRAVVAGATLEFGPVRVTVKPYGKGESI